MDDQRLFIMWQTDSGELSPAFFEAWCADTSLFSIGAYCAF